MKVRIFTNKLKKWAVRLSSELSAFLRKKGYALVDENEDVSIVVGGDGTIFYYREEIKGIIFGIGSKKSKVCTAHKDNWKSLLSSFLSKPQYSNRLFFKVYLNGRYLTLSINDVVLHSSDYKLNRFKYEGKNDVKGVFYSDAIIVSTPTGSTAYSFSAGGPILVPSLDCYVITPVAPYLKASSPIVLKEKLEVKVERKCTLIIDGQSIYPITPSDRITIIPRKGMRFAEVV